jgi:hypothetical protein
MKNRPSVKSRIDTMFINNENPISENEIAIESKSNNEPIIESQSNHNPKSNPIMEKVKYTDTRTQRAFYYDKNLIKVFDKEYPKSKYDKSQIMNELLRKFLIGNGKI